MGACGCKEKSNDGEIAVGSGGKLVPEHGKVHGGFTDDAARAPGDHAPSPSWATLIKEEPKYSNPNTEQTLSKVGKFNYNCPNLEDSSLPQLGPYELENNAVYIGQWKLGARHGRGRQIWTDGSEYEGYWQNNTANGKGRLIHADGDVYEGDWVNDKAQGKGKYTHLDGATYEGEWFEDKQNGQGVETWPDGARYEGSYNMGKKHGFGKFFWSDDSCY